MKKLFFITSLIGIAFTSSSCLKNYTCECTYDGQTISAEITNARHTDAKITCNYYESEYQSSDPDAKCTLK